MMFVHAVAITGLLFCTLLTGAIHIIKKSNRKTQVHVDFWKVGKVVKLLY